MLARCVATLKPPPELTLSQWADRYRMLSAESSAEPGRWHTDKAPYQREIMDAIGDAHIRRVVIMCAAQLGKTELLLNILGYFMAYAPAPILVMQPTLDMGQTFSKDRLAPMIRDTPVLRGLVDVKSRYAGNTILKKNFPGGHITIVGANSATGLASRPIKVLLADEVDRYPGSAKQHFGIRKRLWYRPRLSRGTAALKPSTTNPPARNGMCRARSAGITSLLCGQT